jgi:hypothetical protein
MDAGMCMVRGAGTYIRSDVFVRHASRIKWRKMRVSMRKRVYYHFITGEIGTYGL